MSRASRARLDLVEDEECPVLVAQLAQSFEKAIGRLVHAALALDGLDEHGCRLRAHHRLRRLEVAEGGVGYPRQHRAEAILQDRLGRRREAAVGTAVEGLRERKD